MTGITVDEAYDLARRAIYHATFRDAMSGGFVNCACLLLSMLMAGHLRAQCTT